VLRMLREGLPIFISQQLRIMTWSPRKMICFCRVTHFGHFIDWRSPMTIFLPRSNKVCTKLVYDFTSNYNKEKVRWHTHDSCSWLDDLWDDMWYPPNQVYWFLKMRSEDQGNLISFRKSKIKYCDGGNPRKCHLKVEH
jgi:hypothetical protein